MNKKVILASAASSVVLMMLVFIMLARNNKDSNQTTKDGCIYHMEIEICSDEFEGLTLSNASQLANEKQLTVKLKSVDGNDSIANTDLGGTPIYFTIENEIVIKAEF